MSTKLSSFRMRGPMCKPASIISVLAIVGTALPLMAQTPPSPIVRVEGLRPISPHVYIIPDNSVPLVPNVGYVIRDRAALVIDTGLGPRNGAAVYKIERLRAGELLRHLVAAQGFPPWRGESH